MYDAVAEAVPLAAAGPHPKKAHRGDLGRQRHVERDRTLEEVRQLIRESEVLVYAIGIDGEPTDSASADAPAALPSADADAISDASEARRRTAASGSQAAASRGRSSQRSSAAAASGPTTASTSARCAR